MEEYTLIIAGLSIFFAAIVGYKSGIATAFLEILAGVAIAAMFDFHSGEFIEVMAELGLITLMFLAGLEVDLKFFKEKAKESLTVGLISYFVPFVVLFFATQWLFDITVMQALLFSIGLCEVSAGMLFPILRRKGPLGPRRRMILSAGMIMEFLSIFLLGVIYTEVNWVVIIAITFIIALRIIIPRLQDRFKFLREYTVESSMLKLILALLLISQFLAEASGIDVVLVAFAMGMVLADVVRAHPTVHKEVESIGFGFLTPIFFFTVGLSLNLLDLWNNGLEIILLVAVSFTATYAATYVIAKKHFPSRARVIAVIFNAPMSVGIVVATIGYEREVLDTQLYTLLVGAVVLSSFIAAVFGKYPLQADEMKKMKQQDLIS